MVQPQHAGDVLVELFTFIKIFRVSCGKFNDRDVFPFTPSADECVFLSLSLIVPDAVIDGVDRLEIASDRLHDEQKSGMAIPCM